MHLRAIGSCCLTTEVEREVRALGGPWTFFCPVQGAKLCSNSCDGFLVKRLTGNGGKNHFPTKYFGSDQGGRGEAIKAYSCTLIEPNPKSNAELGEKTPVGCRSSSKVHSGGCLGTSRR